MPLKVKDATASAAKFAQNGQNATGAYKAGVMSDTTQNAAAIAAVPKWQAAVASPAAAAAMSSGLTRAGQAAWQQGASVKGAQNFGPGIARSQQKWAANTTPYLQIIAGLNLDPRGIRGSASNINRVAQVAAALHQAKLQRTGAPGA